MSLYLIIQRSEQATVKNSYRLKHAQEKLARLKNHLTFICQQSAGDDFIFDSLAGSIEMVINFINHHHVVRIFHLVEVGGFNAE